MMKLDIILIVLLIVSFAAY
ncbi:type I toxin-antitoxin system Ibs family toxin [Escherichia coli]|nr:type I toxin-antitoxin system Ibs family toxin [Escherichia coli]